MKKKTAKKPFLEEYREGFAVDELNRKMDVVLEHVIGLSEKAKEHDERFDDIDRKLETMNVKLTGKADTSSVEKIERRVTHLEGAL